MVHQYFNLRHMLAPLRREQSTIDIFPSRTDNNPDRFIEIFKSEVIAMFCNNCGAQLEEGTKFCAVCGAPVQDAAPVQQAAPQYEAPAQEVPSYEAPVYDAAPAYTPAPAYNAVSAENPFAGSVLKWGIMALAFACSFYISFLGIVFGIKAKNTAADALAANNGQPLSGKAKVGAILGKVGLIVGIVMTAILALYLLILIIVAIANS